MSEYPGDRQLLAEAIRLIRERFPLVVSVALETTDQDTRGFMLRDVTGPNGDSMAETERAGFEQLADDVWEYLSSIGWDGVIGEDYYGFATLTLTD